MKTSAKAFLFLLISIVFIGCANTRNPMPCPAQNSHDENLTCDEIFAEYKSNTTSADHKISKNNGDDVQDFFVGFLIWPGLADFKNADGIEGNAILDRNLYLMELAKMKECDVISLPVQPERYD